MLTNAQKRRQRGKKIASFVNKREQQRAGYQSRQAILAAEMAKAEEIPLPIEPPPSMMSVAPPPPPPVQNCAFPPILVNPSPLSQPALFRASSNFERVLEPPPLSLSMRLQSLLQMGRLRTSTKSRVFEERDPKEGVCFRSDSLMPPPVFPLDVDSSPLPPPVYPMSPMAKVTRAPVMEDPFDLTLEDVIPASLQKPASGIFDKTLQMMQDCRNHPLGSWPKSCTTCRNHYWERELHREKNKNRQMAAEVKHLQEKGKQLHEQERKAADSNRCLAEQIRTHDGLHRTAKMRILKEMSQKLRYSPYIRH